MARFGKLPVIVPQGVKVELSPHSVKVTGPKGSLERPLPEEVSAAVSDTQVTVAKKRNSKSALSQEGTTRAHILNMIKGVTEGWSEKLELVGAGYRGELRGTDLVLNVGYTQPVVVKAPDGISFKIEKSVITVEGTNKDLVGQVSANIRAIRPPDPYKGKGIKFVGEYLKLKPGKQAAKTTGAGA